MTSPAAAAAEDRPRRKLYTQHVEEATERALRGEDVREQDDFGGRFKRDGQRERELVVPGRRE